MPVLDELKSTGEAQEKAEADTAKAQA